MNSQSDRPKSLEELKALNRSSQVEVLTLLNGLLQRQQRIEDAIKMMMTTEDAERILNQTDSLNNSILSLTEQVGKMRESNTTSIENMERASRKSVRSLTHTARNSIILTAIVASLSTLLLTLLSRLL